MTPCKTASTFNWLVGRKRIYRGGEGLNIHLLDSIVYQRSIIIGLVINPAPPLASFLVGIYRIQEGWPGATSISCANITVYSSSH